MHRSIPPVPACLAVVLALLALGALGACGGGSTGAPEGEATTPDIPTGPPTPGGSPPPREEPPGEEPPGEEPPGEEPPGEEPPGEEPPGGEPPGGEEPAPPPPLEPLPVYEPYPDVHAVAVDAATGIAYALQRGTGELFVLAPGAPEPVRSGPVGVLDAQGLACDGAYLYAVTPPDGGAAGAVLFRVELDGSASEVVGEIVGHDAVTSLTWHAPRAALYGVDADGDVLLRIDATTGEATPVGPLGEDGPGVVGLTSDPDEDVLYGSRGDQPRLVAIDPGTGDAEPRTTPSEGAMDGLGFDPGVRTFVGAVAAPGRLHVLDPMGSRIHAGDIRGLAFDAGQGVLYGTHVAHGLLVGIDPATRWRREIGYLPLPMLEGLAYVAGTRTLYATSSVTRTLYRIDPDDASYETVGPVADVTGAEPWKELVGLTWADGALVAFDVPTRTLVRIDAATGRGVPFAGLPDHGAGVRGLAFDADTGLLHAYDNATRSHVTMDIRTSFVPETKGGAEFEAVEALAWLPEGSILLGTEGVLDALVEIYRERVLRLAFDQIAALALGFEAERVRGFDLATAQHVSIDALPQHAVPLQPQPGALVEAMADAPDRGVVYAVDNATATLFAIDETNAVAPVGAPGALGTTVIRALAYDMPRGTLWGVDATTRRLVRVSLEDGHAEDAFPAGDALPYERIEAMTYDPDTDALLALDRATRALVEIDRDTGEASGFATLAEDLPAVSAMVCLPSLHELVVVDVDRDHAVHVDRFTGDTLEPFLGLETTRGGADAALATLWWPRGDVRLADGGGLESFAAAVGLGYEADGFLEFRRGDEVLHRAPFAPETIVTIGRLPNEVRAALRVGDTITWGVVFADRDDRLASFTIVERPEASAALATLEGSAYLRKQSTFVRELLAARALLRHGLSSEALVRFVRLAARHEDSPSVFRGIVTALRALNVEDDRIPEVFEIARWIAKSENPAPKAEPPAAKPGEEDAGD